VLLAWARELLTTRRLRLRLVVAAAALLAGVLGVPLVPAVAVVGVLLVRLRATGRGGLGSGSGSARAGAAVRVAG
jgi:hypothetical protein